MATPPRARRSDAQRNRARLLEVARTVLEEQGAQASLRDIARRADVGLGTLYRHFPTREALLAALLGERFDALAAKADALAAAHAPYEALDLWLRDYTVQAVTYQDLTVSLMATLNDETSPLNASCATMRQAVGRLLRSAQESGRVRHDVDGLDLFSLVNSVAWITDRSPEIAARRDHLLTLVLEGLTTTPPEHG